MKNIISILIIVACLASMGMNIEWSKESVKAFITGGVLTWMAIKFFERS